MSLAHSLTRSPPLPPPGCRYGSFLASQLDSIARKCNPPILKPPSRKYISEAAVKYVSYEQVEGYPGHFRKKPSDDDDDDADADADDVASQTQLSIQQVRAVPVD